MMMVMMNPCTARLAGTVVCKNSHWSLVEGLNQDPAALHVN